MNVVMPKIVNAVVLLGIAAAVTWYLIQAFAMQQESGDSVLIGPGSFPMLVAISTLALVVVCLIQFIVKISHEWTFPTGNSLTILIVVASIAIYIYVWSINGQLFYPLTFVFLFGLIAGLGWTESQGKTRHLIFSACISIGLTLFIHVVFGLLFDIRFG